MTVWFCYTNVMKKIGEGWQYSVYDIGNGRVLKKFHSWPKAYWVILKTIFPFGDDSLWKIPGFIEGAKRMANTSFEILRRKHVPKEWIGNPKFVSQYDFEQDKVQPLHDVFEKADSSKARETIDKFVEFNKRLLAIGVIDKSFNITKNYGLNEEGEIVLIDIGEIFDDQIKIERQRRNRAWEKYYVARCIKGAEERDYFIKEMDKNFGILQ